MDGLMFQEQDVSQVLTEVRFFRQPFLYQTSPVRDDSIRKVVVQQDYVNRPSHLREYILLNGQVIETQRSVMTPKEDDLIENQLFYFPDGMPGMVVRDNTTRTPFGWGECGKCIDETIWILKINPDGVQVIAEATQSNGPEGYCQIGDNYFAQHYVSQIDILNDGRFAVLRLNQRGSKERKRIKVDWSTEASKVRIFPVK
ncbi:MAG: hypothetical protein AAF206_24205 [Bacteroidota bacterium]